MEVLGPFTDRPLEWKLYQPLFGESMLELGNKKNGRHGTYKAFFEGRGFRHTSVDWNGDDGALPLDLRRPLNLGTFDMVTNIGTTEHVDQQEPVWQNICEAMHIGSVLISTTPLPGGEDWWWHGDWYPTLKFFEELGYRNGLEVQRLYVAGDAPRRMIMARLRRIATVSFKMPAYGTIVHNVRKPR